MEVVERIIHMPELQKSQPYVMYSTAAELRRYRAREIAVARAKEMAEDPTKRIPFTQKELIKRGVI